MTENELRIINNVRLALDQLVADHHAARPVTNNGALADAAALLAHRIHAVLRNHVPEDDEDLAAIRALQADGRPWGQAREWWLADVLREYAREVLASNDKETQR